MKKKTTIIITVVVINIVLIASLVTLYFTVFNNPADEWSLTITGQIDQEIIFSIEDLMTLPNITKDYLLQGTPTFTAEYTGVSVYYLITEIANISSNVNIRVIAVDQYATTLNFENDLNTSKDTIIAYMKNGEFMKSRRRGGEGPLRLIIPQKFEGDFNAQFCVKYVTTIEIL